jgi:hypothetical protein
MSTDASEPRLSEVNKIKLALIKSLVRKPCACVFPHLSWIKKSEELNVYNVMDQIKKWESRYTQNSTLDIGDELYVLTVKEFCREYTEIKTNFEKEPGNINNLLAYVELLCLYIKFSIIENCTDDECVSTLVEAISVSITNRTPKINLRTLDTSLAASELFKQVYNDLHEMIFIIIDILNKYDVISESQESSLCPGLTDFVLSIIRDKVYFLNSQS